jgi:hypothetical protein
VRGRLPARLLEAEALPREDRPCVEPVRRLRDSAVRLPVLDLLLELPDERLLELALDLRDLLLPLVLEEAERVLRDLEDDDREELLPALRFDLCAMNISS